LAEIHSVKVVAGCRFFGVPSVNFVTKSELAEILRVRVVAGCRFFGVP
jgi:hypothetical protein